GLLLGLVFHHARPGRKRAARAGGADAGQLRPPDRPLGPYPQRQPQLLPEPFAAAVLLAHGRAGSARRSGRGHALPGPAPARARVLDGWRRRPAPGPGASPRGAAGRRQPAQPLLGRPRHAAPDRGLRAGAESGWDFSSRGLDDPMRLDTIHVTSRVPVDLNSLLHHLETTIAGACEQAGDAACARDYTARAQARAAAIERHL